MRLSGVTIKESTTTSEMFISIESHLIRLEMDGNDEVPTEEADEARDVCRKIMGQFWSKGPIRVKYLSGGLMNKLILCTLSEANPATSPGPTQVLARFLTGKNKFCSMGEAGETIAFYVFSQQGLGPTLYGVFPGGRLEEYIPSRILETSDYNNLETNLALARKVAHIHSLEVPVRKDASVIFKLIKRVQRMICGKKLSLTGFNEIDRLKAKQFLAIDLGAELEWIGLLISKISTRLVYSHGDFYRNNILIRTEENEGGQATEGEPTFDDKLVIIDLEIGCYFYRGLDLGAHFIDASFDVDPTTGNPAFIGSIGDEEKLFFIREYLREWEKRNPMTFDPELDTEEKLLLESDCVGLVYISFTLLWFVENLERDDNFSREVLLDLALLWGNIYLTQKKRCRERVPHL